jgi:cell division protein FtsL
VKWVILVVVVILAAPSIATRLQALDPDNADDPDKTADQVSRRRRGIVYRSVRRFGPRKVFVAFVLIVAILAVAVYVLVRQI